MISALAAVFPVSTTQSGRSTASPRKNDTPSGTTAPEEMARLRAEAMLRHPSSGAFRSA